MKYILWTEEEGGNFKAVTWHDDNITTHNFREAVKKKQLVFQIGDKLTKVVPAYMVLVAATEDFDFVLGKARKDPKEYIQIFEHHLPKEEEDAS